MDTRYSEVVLPPLPEALEPLLETALPEKAVVDRTEIGEIPTTRPIRIRRLHAGCYLLTLTTNANRLLVFDGTLRVEHHANGTTASGDLYQRATIGICPKPLPGIPARCFHVLAPAPDPAEGIPIFPRNRYQAYLRVTQILEWFTLANSFTLGFEIHRFNSDTRSWEAPVSYTALMTWTTPPTGYPYAGDYIEGEVKTAAGVVVGRLSMGRVSTYLRKAVIEIDRVAASEVPLNNGAGVDWRTIFDQVGWDMTVVESNTNCSEASGESWSDSECHAGMLTWRDTVDLDKQWRYHLLCVRRLDSTSRGIMYDAYGGDSNNIPREGAAISSHWQFTNDPVFPENRNWGLCAGLRFGQSVPAYFRTAVHEIGHAMMMFHPMSSTGNHIMQVTPQIAANVVPPEQFPNNIEWAFRPEDARCLRHLPDVVVRPGTVMRFGTDVGSSYLRVPISPLDFIPEAETLRLHVAPLLEAVPIGAPVRVNYTLVNTGDEPVPVPRRLGLKEGNVTGRVIDASGNVRIFSTIIRYLDTFDMQMLEKDDSMSNSLTLLRGPEGALFPSAGMYRIIVTVSWELDNVPVALWGETSVMVTPPVDDQHARAALKVLNTPDALLTLAIGGDHLAEGIEAVHTALNNPVLHPHFAYVEAKRLAQRSGKRKSNLKAAAALITDATVMSPAEVHKAAKMVKAEGADSAPAKSIISTLKQKAKTLPISNEAKDILDAL